MTMDKGNKQIAQGSQDLRSMASAQTRAIFLEGDITHVMRAILVARQEGSLPPARLQNRT